MELSVKETLEDFNPFRLINNKLEGIEGKLLEVLETQTNNPRVEIVSGDVLCERFNVTRQTLGRWRDQGRIPFIQVGSIVRYDFLKVINALEKGGL